MTETVEAEVTQGSGNIFVDLGVTMTLDDVSKRINSFCVEYLEETKRLQQEHDTKLRALADAVEASPDIDEQAAIAIIFGRLKQLIGELNAVIG